MAAADGAGQVARSGAFLGQVDALAAVHRQAPGRSSAIIGRIAPREERVQTETENCQPRASAHPRTFLEPRSIYRARGESYPAVGLGLAQQRVEVGTVRSAVGELLHTSAGPVRTIP